MDDVLRGLALVTKGLRDCVSRASYSLGLGTLFFGCTLLLLDQGLLVVSDLARWLVGVGTLSIGATLGRQLDSRSAAALPAPPARKALSTGAADERGQWNEPATRHAHVHLALAVELARVANDAGAAKMLAKRAGFPAEHLPDFKTAIGFWTEIVEDTTNGRGNLMALAGEAINQFPHNPSFREYAEAIGSMSLLMERRGAAGSMTGPSASATLRSEP